MIAAALALCLSTAALAEPAGPAVKAVPAVEAAEVSDLRERLAEQEAELAELRARLDDDLEDTVQLSVTVEPERVTFGGTSRVPAGEQVEEAVAFGGNVDVSGRVLGDATAFGGDVIVHNGGSVDGDAVSFGGIVQVHPGGSVQGDRVSLSGASHLVPTVSTAATVDEPGFLQVLYRRVIFLLSLLGAGVLVVGLVPERVGRVARAVDGQPLRSLLVGAFAVLFLSVATLLFAVTIIGIPISLLLVGGLGLAWLLGFVGLSQALGDRIPALKQPRGRWLAFLVGGLVVTFAGFLPFVGWLVILSTSILGVGAALVSRFGAK